MDRVTPSWTSPTTPCRPDEANVFRVKEALSVATALMRSSRFVGDAGSALSLRDPRGAEFGLLGLSTAAKQHLQRGEDLLTLVERSVAMMDAGIRRQTTGTRIDAGLHLLRAIAMAELLGEEADKYRRDTRIREMADRSIARLAEGFVTRFGTNVPEDVARVFPHFAAAVRRVQRPVPRSAV